MKSQIDMNLLGGKAVAGDIDDSSGSTKQVCRARLRKPNRRQVELRPVDLESTLSEDHRARVVWAFVEELDLMELYGEIGSVEGGPGRPATDPRVFMALWLFATLEGVGSARALARLCKRDDAYRWICGGVPVNYHTLADFRVAHEEVLDRLLTESAAALMAEGLVELRRVAQDGVRVRASAGAASFRRERTLEACYGEAQEQVEALKKEVNEDPGASDRRIEGARRRAAEERKERVEAALQQLAEVKAKKKKEVDREKARVSTTDPEVRVMKMADGGFRPAFNVQFATDTQTQVIVGVDISNSGSDQGKMTPMLDQIENRYDRKPDEFLVDGGFAGHVEIEKATDAGVRIYSPVMKPKGEARDVHEPRATDSQAIADWRRRMGTEDAKEIYKERAATAECVNALARNRGLRQFLVRGLQKAKAVVLWHALAHNLMRAFSLRGSRAALAAT